MSKHMKKLFLGTILVALLIGCLGRGTAYAYFIGQHWIVGTVEAPAEILKQFQDKEVNAYLSANPDDQATDIIGINGNSGKADHFQINIYENPLWEPYTKVSLQIPPQTIDGKEYAAIAVIETTHQGYDFLSAPLTIAETANLPAKTGLSFEELDINIALGSSPPPPVVLNIKNEGFKTLNYTATTDAAWLTLGPANGKIEVKATQSLVITLETTLLNPGIYAGTIWVSDPDSLTKSETCRIILKISAPIEETALSTSKVLVEAPLGTNPENSTILITNKSDVPITFNVTADANWISIGLDKQTVGTNESLTLDIGYDTKGLAPGTYEATIFISDANDPSQVKTIKVVITIPPPPLGTDKTNIALPPSTTEGKVVLSNNSDEKITYSASTDAAWITLKNPNGTIEAGSSLNLLFSIDKEDLAPGTYEATIWIADPNDPTKTIAVKVTTVVPPKRLSADTLQTSISTSKEGVVLEQKITLSNNSNEKITYSASTDAAWITLKNPNGTIDAGASWDLLFSINKENLAPGTYEATIWVTNPNDKSQTIPITIKLIIEPTKKGAIPTISDVYFGSQIYSPKIIAAGKPFITSSTPMIKASAKGADGIDINSLNLVIDQGAATEQTFKIANFNITNIVQSGSKLTELNYAFQVSSDKALSAGKHQIVFKASNEFGETSYIASVEVMAASPQILDTPLTNPSPFNPSQGQVTIAYTLNVDTDIEIYLFSIAGESIKKISCNAGATGGAAGYNKVTWNGTTDFGTVVANGIYLGVIISRNDKKVLKKFKLAVFE